MVYMYKSPIRVYLRGVEINDIGTPCFVLKYQFPEQSPINQLIPLSLNYFISHLDHDIDDIEKIKEAVKTCIGLSIQFLNIEIIIETDNNEDFYKNFRDVVFSYNRIKVRS